MRDIIAGMIRVYKLLAVSEAERGDVDHLQQRPSSAHSCGLFFVFVSSCVWSWMRYINVPYCAAGKRTSLMVPRNLLHRYW